MLGGKDTTESKDLSPYWLARIEYEERQSRTQRVLDNADAFLRTRIEIRALPSKEK